MNDKGFGPAALDKSSTNKDAIRGREQQLIDSNGGAKSQRGTSGNAINGISPNNKKKNRYMKSATDEFVGVYNSSVSLMKYVEKRPYVTESEVTSPPTYIRDCISGEYSIYYANGDIVPSTYEECKNLEVCAVWELSHVIDRLMGDDKWQKCMAL